MATTTHNHYKLTHSTLLTRSASASSATTPTHYPNNMFMSGNGNRTPASDARSDVSEAPTVLFSAQTQNIGSDLTLTATTPNLKRLKNVEEEDEHEHDSVSYVEDSYVPESNYGIHQQSIRSSVGSNSNSNSNHNNNNSQSYVEDSYVPETCFESELELDNDNDNDNDNDEHDTSQNVKHRFMSLGSLATGATGTCGSINSNSQETNSQETNNSYSSSQTPSHQPRSSSQFSSNTNTTKTPITNLYTLVKSQHLFSPAELSTMVTNFEEQLSEEADGGDEEGESDMSETPQSAKKKEKKSTYGELLEKFKLAQQALREKLQREMEDKMLMESDDDGDDDDADDDNEERQQQMSERQEFSFMPSTSQLERLGATPKTTTTTVEVNNLDDYINSTTITITAEKPIIYIDRNSPRGVTLAESLHPLSDSCMAVSAISPRGGIPTGE